MQRSITYQNALNTLLWVGVFSIYSALTSIYLFLPPLFAVIGYLLYRSLIRYDLFSLIVYSVMLLIIEAEKGYWFGSSVLFFILISHFLLPRLEQNMRCDLCVKGIFVLSSYLLFWIFMSIINTVLLLPAPGLDWHVLFYMGIEFALIAMFV
ncbi:MAG TPA: hypothetical protein VFX68_04490 [Sulfuricurvum sp.]|nr:hypothetical protein [Sulfuricurvum sp.]